MIYRYSNDFAAVATAAADDDDDAAEARGVADDAPEQGCEAEARGWG